MVVIPAQAPSIDAGWSKDYYTTTVVKGFAYDVTTSFLYVFTYYTEQFNVFLNVPFGTAQFLVYVPNPDQYYAGSIDGDFPQCLLTEACVPLLTEDGKYLVI